MPVFLLAFEIIRGLGSGRIYSAEYLIRVCGSDVILVVIRHVGGGSTSDSSDDDAAKIIDSWQSITRSDVS